MTANRVVLGISIGSFVMASVVIARWAIFGGTGLEAGLGLLSLDLTLLVHKVYVRRNGRSS